MNNETSKIIDALRGFSSLVVVLAHTFQWFILPMLGLDHIAREISSSAAHVAVIIFFVLSGFVITHSLASNYSANGRIEPSVYIKSRLTRILPAGLFGITLSLAVLFVIKYFDLHGSKTFRTGTELYVARESLNFSLKDAASCVIFSNGMIPGTGPISTNGPLWSLSIEFWIYFIALLGALAIHPDKSSSYKGARYPSTIGLMLIFMLLAPRVEILEYFIYWGVGSLAFFSKSGLIPKPLLQLSCKLVLISGFSLALWRFSAGQHRHLWEGGTMIIEKLGLVAFGLLAYGCFPKTSRLLRLFCPLSKSSYTLYVTHFPILCLAFSCFHHSFNVWGWAQRTTFLAALVLVLLLFAHFCAAYFEDKRYWSGMYGRIATVFRPNIRK